LLLEPRNGHIDFFDFSIAFARSGNDTVTIQNCNRIQATIVRAKSSFSAPEIPPLAEAGVPGFDTAGWGMIVAPAGTSPGVVTRLHFELNGVLAVSDGSCPQSFPRTITGLHQRGDAALGQSRAAGRARGIGVALMADEVIE
jgi:hypothetical protein